MAKAIKSYVGVVRAKKNRVLLGGNRIHTSCRMETTEMAMHWASMTFDLNKAQGRVPQAYGVRTSQLKPELREDEIAWTSKSD